ncbi:MAG TPA: fibronectin type III domain-containing protein [Frankiaceae bacterium]|nr:fibronectin type III domain-containing protein [Frankiaceae bacterium]
MAVYTGSSLTTLKLLPSTDYQVIVAAINGAGLGDPALSRPVTPTAKP